MHRRAAAHSVERRSTQGDAANELDNATKESEQQQRRQAIIQAVALALRVGAGFLLVVEVLVLLGGETLIAGEPEWSVRFYDAARALGFPKHMLWQRGLALYYSGRYDDGALQFREDAAVKTRDPEESIWAAVCETRGSTGLEEAQTRLRTAVVKSKRPELLTIHTLFRGGAEAQAAQSVLEYTAACGGADGFRAAFYLGLYAEARGDAAAAQRWITQAATSEYADSAAGANDYMAGMAEVHARLRGWIKDE